VRVTISLLSTPPRGVAALVGTVATALALAACSSSGSAPTPAPAPAPTSAADLVSRARSTLDKASSVHFVLSGEGVPENADVLLGGEGDVARPDRFGGVLNVRVSGVQATIAVVAVGGTVYAKLPFSARYEVTDPKKFNIPDPGSFLSPETGLTQLLARATAVTGGGQSRVGNTVVQEVTAQLPGQVVDRFLRTADPATAVRATFRIDPSTGRLRAATLVGPFFAVGTDSTYTLALSRYDEPVDIQAPAG
jgi:lipoprotein LprG